ncbi:MAG: nucleoside deaminase [Planctomycetaceae bacterium]|jgi:guanine deaminase|nr:nucleoside deaminase [Planctomycetaceae bacterium]
MNKFMQLAIDAAIEGMQKNMGGPFGAVIVLNDEVISIAHNEVIGTNDPTAHAEMVAIRRATKILNRFNISDCEIYSTCEPCPMCLSAIHWAGMTKLYFGADRYDAAIGGFDDEFIYKIMDGTADSLLLKPEIIEKEKCAKLFKLWNQKLDRVQY